MATDTEAGGVQGGTGGGREESQGRKRRAGRAGTGKELAGTQGQLQILRILLFFLVFFFFEFLQKSFFSERENTRQKDFDTFSFLLFFFFLNSAFGVLAHILRYCRN